MKSRLYIYLCDDARRIRQRVFIDEQGFTDEFDDKDKISLHIVAYSDSGVPIGTARLFSDEEDVYTIGRVAVEKNARGQGVGRYMIDRLCGECEKRGAKKIVLRSQEQAVPFYKASGFEMTDETMTEDGVLHIKMVRYI